MRDNKSCDGYLRNYRLDNAPHQRPMSAARRRGDDGLGGASGS